MPKQDVIITSAYGAGETTAVIICTIQGGSWNTGKGLEKGCSNDLMSGKSALKQKT